jgi:hypothetical protein
MKVLAYRDELAAAHQRIADLDEEVARLQGELGASPDVRVKLTELDAARLTALARLSDAEAFVRRASGIVGLVLSVPVLVFVLWLVSLRDSGHPLTGFIVSFPFVILGYLITRALAAPRVRRAKLDLSSIERQIDTLEAKRQVRVEVSPRPAEQAEIAEEEAAESEKEASKLWAR